MRHTDRETTTQTLTRLIKAMDAGHPVTVSYLKEERDDGRRTGRLVETVRTIEIYDVTVTAAGDIVLKAMDRDSQESRSFRLDRVRTYSIHRTAYTVPREETTEDTSRTPRPSLATVTLLPLDLAADTDRVAQLADALAA